MEETDKDHDVPKYPDASLKNIFKSVKRRLSDSCRDLSKKVASSEMDPEKFRYSKILRGNQILHSKDKVIKKPFEFSAAGGKRDLINESLSTEGNIVSHLSIDDFQARDGKKSPYKVFVMNLNILKALQESGKMSDLFKSRNTPDTVCSIESKIRKSSQHKSEDITISDSEISNGNVVSTNDMDKDASTSSKRNLQTFPTDDIYSESKSNILSSNFKTLEKDSKLKNTNQQNIFNRDFMNCDSDTLSNSPNNPERSTELSASLISTMDNSDHRQSASQLSEYANALYRIFSDVYPVSHENFKTSEILYPDFNISKNESEISHSNLKPSESDQDLKLDKKSPYVIEKKVQNVIKPFNEFQDYLQIASEKSSELDQTLGSYSGSFTVSDEGMENEVSANLNTIDDDFAYLNLPIGSEDRNEAVQNYLSSIDSTPSMDSTFLNNFECTKTDLKSPEDSDKESYDSDLMYSGSDNESNPNKRSCDIQELIAAEAISGMGLPSNSDQVNFIRKHEIKDEVSTNFIDSDEEALIAKALTSSEDPETVLQDYFSSRNSVPSNVSKTSSMPSEYCSTDLTSSDANQDLNPKKLSRDVKRVQYKVENLINYITDLKRKVQADIATGVFSSRENSSDIDSVSIASVYEAKVSKNSISTTEEMDIIRALISSEDPDTSLADYLSSRNSVPFNALNFSSEPSKYCHSHLMSSDNKDSNSDWRSCEILRVLSEVENLMNNTSEFRGLLKPRQDVITEARAISSIDSTSDNGEVNIVSSHETKDNEMNIMSINTDDASDRLEASIDNLSSRNSKPSRDPMFTGNESEYSKSDLKSSDTFKERPYASEVGKELKNIANAFQGIFLKQKNDDATSFKMDLASDYDRLSLPSSNEERRNEDPGLCDRQNPSKRSEEIKKQIRSVFPIRPFGRRDSNFSDRGSKTFESGLKLSNREQEMSSFKQSKEIDEDAFQRRLSLRIGMKRKMNDSFFDKSLDTDNSKRSSIDYAEAENNNIETIDEIFKKFIKCHPIRKFEIPPYASAYTEEKLWKLDDNFQKHTSNAMHLNGTNENPNILEHVLNLDSHSIMTFDVTDCFSQNSNIICNGLIREYFDISAKVNLQLVKNIKNISSEEYESRIYSLFSLYEELGCISAKFMTTKNDWSKQIREIKENIAQSRIGSRGMYHMALLRICGELCFILNKLTLEKQSELEDYEKILMLHHKNGNYSL